MGSPVVHDDVDVVAEPGLGQGGRVPFDRKNGTNLGIDGKYQQGCSQTLNPGWAREEHFIISPYSIISPIFLIFFLNLVPQVGGSPTWEGPGKASENQGKNWGKVRKLGILETNGQIREGKRKKNWKVFHIGPGKDIVGYTFVLIVGETL